MEQGIYRTDNLTTIIYCHIDVRVQTLSCIVHCNKQHSASVRIEDSGFYFVFYFISLLLSLFPFIWEWEVSMTSQVTATSHDLDVTNHMTYRTL